MDLGRLGTAWGKPRGEGCRAKGLEFRVGSLGILRQLGQGMRERGEQQLNTIGFGQGFSSIVSGALGRQSYPKPKPKPGHKP